MKSPFFCHWNDKFTHFNINNAMFSRHKICSVCLLALLHRKSESEVERECFTLQKLSFTQVTMKRLSIVYIMLTSVVGWRAYYRKSKKRAEIKIAYSVCSIIRTLLMHHRSHSFAGPPQELKKKYAKETSISTQKQWLPSKVICILCTTLCYVILHVL